MIRIGQHSLGYSILQAGFWGQDIAAAEARPSRSPIADHWERPSRLRWTFTQKSQAAGRGRNTISAHSRFRFWVSRNWIGLPLIRFAGSRSPQNTQAILLISPQHFSGN